MTDRTHKWENSGDHGAAEALFDVIDLWSYAAELRGAVNSANRDILGLSNVEFAPLPQQGGYISERISRDELARIRFSSAFGNDLSERTVVALRREINRHGKDPLSVLPSLMSRSRVLAIGESHFDDNPHRKLTAESIAALKANGATHLAMEYPQRIQADLDKFARTGQIDPRVLPPLARDASELAILHAARKAGLKIVAVDADRPYIERARPRRAEIDPFEPREPGVNRDELMAAKIDGILREDGRNKVVFFGGKLHMDQLADKHETAVEILRRRYAVTSVMSQTDGQDTDVLAAMTGGLSRPVMLDMKASPFIAGQKLHKYSDHYYSNWDYVIMYPSKR